MFEDRNDNRVIEEDPSDSAANEVLQRERYYPFGMQLRAPMGPAPAVAHHYLYNGKEQIEGTGLYAYGARYYDAVVGRWMGVDPLAQDFAAWSGYNYVLGNPVRLVDPDGAAPEDIVYFNSSGKEIHRVKSNTEFRTFVATGLVSSGNPQENYVLGIDTYVEAAMPNVFLNRAGNTNDVTSGRAFQDHDYLIAAHTEIFNRGVADGSLSLVSEGGNTISSEAISEIPRLDPTLVKAIGLQESHLGQDRFPDIMTANAAGDWSAFKSSYGLAYRGGVANVGESIKAGIRILATKGFRNGTTYDKNTGVSTYTFQGWNSATSAFNGGGVADYLGDVTKSINGSRAPVPEDY